MQGRGNSQSEHWRMPSSGQGGFRMAGTTSELSIRVKGEIMRCDAGAVAIKFTGIDPDSLFHLQNIIRYNSSNPEAVDKEIRHHPGLV